MDVRIYAWRAEDEDWKPLTFDEKKRLWNLRAPRRRPDPQSQSRRWKCLSDG